MSRWDRIWEAFAEALERPAAERAAWVNRQWAEEPHLAAEVQRLLEAHQDDGFLAPPDSDDAAPSDENLGGRRIAERYVLGSSLGQGGSSTVYRARDEVLGADVAVKVMARPGSVVGAMREAAVLRLVRLPGVVRLLDDGHDGEIAYLVMELVEGRPFPGRDGAVPWSELERPVLALLETLARIHAHGIVHRDLKPGNVLIEDDGRPVVLDLGLSESAWGHASRARHGVAGTLRYMAPEQRRGAWSVRSDLHAVGVMLREALTGSRPDDATPSRPAELGDGVPEPVARLIERLTASEPAERPASAIEAIAALPRASRSVVVAIDAATPEGLRRLFRGPDRLLHLREDGAVELFRRTGGRGDAVARELAAWERAGLGGFEGARFRIDRPALERLRSGLRVLAPVAPADVGTARSDPEGRLLAWVAAGELEHVPGEALRLARLRLAEGHVPRAWALVLEGLRAAGGDGAIDTEVELLETLLSAGFQLGTMKALDEVQYRLSRGPPGPRGEAGLRIARAAGFALSGRKDEALAELGEVEDLPTEELLNAAFSVSLYAVRALSDDAQKEQLDRAEDAGRRFASDRLLRMVRSGHGWLAYAQGRYEASARHHLAAARAKPPPRMLPLLNAASAWLEAGRFEDARALAEEARAEAESHRTAALEARAVWILRAVAYRSGEDIAVDPELLEAVRRVGNPQLLGLLLLNESAIARARGEDDDAAGLAEEAASAWDRAGSPSGAWLARALAFALGRPGDPDALLDEAEGCPLPRIVLQAAALIASRDPERMAACRALYEAREDALDTPADLRWDVLSPAEVRAVLGEP